MLNIVVLIKQVPNTTQIKLDPETNNLVREGVPSILNPYDLYAIEEALLLKERYGAKVTALSMGPKQSVEVIKYAYAMGADAGLLLSDRAFAGADTLATSYTISAALRRLKQVDLVLCGKQAADGDTAQVPAELAEHLGISCLTYVSRITMIKEGKIIAARTLDSVNILAESTLPAVLTINKGVNKPRLPQLKDMVRAMHIPVEILTATDLTLDHSRISLAGSPTQVIKVFTPERKKDAIKLEGGAAEQAVALLELLEQRDII